MVKNIILFSTPDKLYDPVTDEDEMKFLIGDDVRARLKNFNPDSFYRDERYYRAYMSEETYLIEIKGHSIDDPLLFI
jgi:hypothetical protein